MIDDMAVYIANLGKYNEGYLVGAWFTFPIDEEDVKEKIGLNEQYEEYAIHDTDNFPIAIGEYVSIEELNEMYEMIEELPDYIVECLDEFISHYGTLEEVVEHKDDIYYYPDCETMTDVAYYYIDELQALGSPYRRFLLPPAFHFAGAEVLPGSGLGNRSSPRSSRSAPTGACPACGRRCP